MITSRDNSLLRQARAVRDGKIKELIFVEGLRLCEEALASKLKIEAVIFSDEIARKERAAAFLQTVSNVGAKLAEISEKLLASISYTKTPQGIIVLASRPSWDQKTLERVQPNAPLIVIMHGINNPVNVGAILRTAEAAGATGAIATVNTSDPFSPKSLRGAMGSAFRLPIWTETNYKQVIAWCAQRKIQTVCTDVKGSMAHTEIDWRGPRAVIVGPESTGLSRDEVSAAGAAIRILMQGNVESLNVAVATAVVLFEAARQRELKS